MLYVVFGNDRTRVTRKTQALIDALHSKRRDAELFFIDSENMRLDVFEELTQSQGLFEKKYIVRVVECNRELLTEVLPLCQESENVFLFTEGVLDANTKKLFDAHAEKMWECTVAEKKKEYFNTFALTDAVGERSRGKAWVLFEEAVRSGVSPEEIHGVLWWQVKNMLLVSKTTSATEAGLKPFVYSKTKKALTHFSTTDIEMLAHMLMQAYTNARRGKVDLRVGLELFVLGI